MIKWITDNLGTAAFQDAVGLEDAYTVDVRELVDKAGNPSHLILAKIDEAAALLRGGNKVVVACDYGISRSNTVAAAALAMTAKMTFEDALGIVSDKTGGGEMVIAVVSKVRESLAQRDVEFAARAYTAKKRMLLTGGSGFVGSRIVSALRECGDVYCPPHGELDLLLGPAPLDLYINKNSIDTVVHLAMPKNKGTNKSMGESVGMTKNVLDACSANGLRMIYLSDIAVFSGYETSWLRANESLEPLPAGSYAEGKYLSELLIGQYVRRTGLRCTVIRPGTIYGGQGNKPKVIYTIAEKALKNAEIALHKYSNDFPALDLLHIDDLADGVRLAIVADFDGIVHMGSGRLTYVKDAAQMMIKETGSKSKIRFIELESPASNVFLDASLAASKLNWSPRRGLQDYLKEVVYGLMRGGGID